MNNLSRKEKINLLNEVQAGKITVKEALMPEYTIHYKDLDGMYKESGQLMTQEQFEAHCKSHPAKKHIIFYQEEGNAPLNEVNS